ncbi:hypothetical protein LSAT2_032940 [Lamellibrachia satsuma]|nr:hypothetical protein LSAT2_032940 [Lamellibrachia satsuma]
MSQRHSQKTLLEEVSSWDSQTCQERLGDVLPQLICVLSALPTEKIEEQLLSKVTDKVTAHFDKTLGRLLHATSEGLETVLSDLQLALELVGCVELCVSGLSSRDTELHMSHIHSLPPLVLRLVQGSYTHCKESGAIYKELLGSVSAQLSALFRKVHSLQMEFISMIDKVVIESSQDDLQDMCAVIHGLCDLSDVATTLDVKIMITIWKTTSRWLCRYKHQLSDWVDVGRLLGSLCSQICASYSYTTSMVSHDLQVSGWTYWGVDINCSMAECFTEKATWCWNEHVCGGVECKVCQGVECKVCRGVECKVCREMECKVCRGMECKVCCGVECKVCRGVECKVCRVECKVCCGVECKESEDKEEEKLFRKNVKILGFQMKVLVTLVKEFTDYLGNCVPQLVILILTVQSRIPPSLLAANIRRDYIDDIERHVSSGISPLLSYLIPNAHFRQCLTIVEQDTECLSRCLILITVAGMLSKHPEDVRSLWVEPGKGSSNNTQGLPLMKAVFDCLPHCYTELCVPVKLLGASVAAKPHRAIPLFEYVVTRMCAFAIVCSAQHFHVIERCLLENVFSRNLHSALLASDVWCFLARCGTAEQCHQSYILLAKLYITVLPSSASQCCHLAALLRRMVKLLTSQYQEVFISQFAVSPKNLDLWSVMSMSDLDVSVRHQVVDRIVTVCTQVMQDWSHMSTRTGDDAIKLASALSCLTNLFRSENVAQYADTKQRTFIVKTLHDTWQTLSMTFVTRCPVQQNVLSGLFSLAAYVLSHLDNKHILQFVRDASACLTHGISSHVKLAILCFLEHLGAKTLPPTFEDQILRSLPALYSSLLADTNFVVHRSALVSFAQFAETTLHESVVPECLHGNSHVQKSVVHYLNQLAGTAPAVDMDQDYLDAEGQTLRMYLARSTEAESELDVLQNPSHALPSTSQDTRPHMIPSKRFKAESVAGTEERDVTYKNILSQLQLNLDNLTDTAQDSCLPPWVQSQLVDMQGQFTKLMQK